MSSVLATVDRSAGCCGLYGSRGFHALQSSRDGVSTKTRLYISRSRLPEGCAGSRAKQSWISCCWIAAGPIYPEQLPVNEQLRHLRQAQVIAGPLGSAFHLLFAFGAAASPLLLTLGFPDELTTDGPGLNFGLQFRRQQMLVEHLPLLALQDSST